MYGVVNLKGYIGRARALNTLDKSLNIAGTAPQPTNKCKVESQVCRRPTVSEKCRHKPKQHSERPLATGASENCLVGCGLEVVSRIWTSRFALGAAHV